MKETCTLFPQCVLCKADAVDNWMGYDLCKAHNELVRVNKIMQAKVLGINDK